MKQRVWLGLLMAGLLCCSVSCFTTREMYTHPGATHAPGGISDPQHRGTSGESSPGRPATVTATQAKVTASARLVASASSAQQDQSDTGIYLTLDNRSSRPLRLGHGQLSLLSDAGGPYPARPLRVVAPTTTGRADTGDEFAGRPLERQPDDRALAAKQAAPPIIEGVVVPGEHVAGMVYFAEATTDGVGLRLAIQLVDVRDGAQVGRIELPLPASRPARPTVESPQATDANAQPPK